MSQNAAAQAILDALKVPDLKPGERAGLLAALQAALSGPPASSEPVAPAAAEPAPRAAKTRQPKAERRAESLRLTREAIAAMGRPAKGERLVYDDACPQLAVRLRPGSATFIVVMWDRTRRRKTSHTLGKTDTLTPEQARRKAQALVANVADGKDVRRVAVDGITVAQLIDRWHAERSKSNRTADEMKAKALDHLGRAAQQRADELTVKQVGAIHHHIATKAHRRVLRGSGDGRRLVEIGEPGLPATADKWLAIMGSVFTWGTGKGLVAANPCEGIGKAYDARGAARDTYLHGDALLRFWQALHDDPDADARDVLLLALYTGQRKGNVLAMCWAQVNLDDGLWIVPGSATKQKAPQANPLIAQAREILLRRRLDAAGPWIFPATRAKPGEPVGHMSTSRPRDAWERICKAAGLEDVRIHDLRHTSGSWLARLGSNEAIRMKALGHKTPAMAARYSHLELDPVAEAMQRAGDAITAAATKTAARPATGKGAAK